MGVSTSTAYRCVADLVGIGLLQPVSGGAYVLGPAFSEFDLRMRLSDPLLRAARPHMAKLRDVLGRETTTALARYDQDRVMFVHLDRARDIPNGPVRGQQISLFSPAAIARAMLFALPDRVLRTLYQRHAADVAAQGLGDDAREFRAHVRALRERGWATADVGRRRGARRHRRAGGLRRHGARQHGREPPRAAVRRRDRAHRRDRRAARRPVAAQLREDDPDVPRLLGRRPSTPSTPYQSGAPLQ